MFSLLSFLPALSKQSASPQKEANKYVHFSRDLLQTLNAVHVRRRLSFHLLSSLRTCHRSASVWVGCIMLSYPAVKLERIAGFGNWDTQHWLRKRTDFVNLIKSLKTCSPVSGNVLQGKAGVGKVIWALIWGFLLENFESWINFATIHFIHQRLNHIILETHGNNSPAVSSLSKERARINSTRDKS